MTIGVDEQQPELQRLLVRRPGPAVEGIREAGKGREERVVGRRDGGEVPVRGDEVAQPRARRRAGLEDHEGGILRPVAGRSEQPLRPEPDEPRPLQRRPGLAGLVGPEPDEEPAGSACGANRIRAADRNSRRAASVSR